MKRNPERKPANKSSFLKDRPGDMYFLKLIIKWLGIAVLLLIVGVLAYILIPK